MPPAGLCHDRLAAMIECGIEEDVLRDTDPERSSPVVRAEGRVSVESMRLAKAGRVHG